MGILVRLLTSLVGALVVGSFGAVVCGGAAFGLVAMTISLFGRAFVPAPSEDLDKVVLPVLFGLTGLCGFIGACVGIRYGYRGGLAVGREICAVDRPESHSRHEVDLTHKRQP